jgi:membrane-bound lytic murein transglycosylase B
MNIQYLARNINKLWPRFKVGIATLALMSALGLGLCDPAAAKGRQVFEPLRPHLISAGFSRQLVAAWLASPKLRFESRLMAALLAKPEHTLDYGQFLESPVIKRARSFSRRYASQLRQAHIDTGVPPGLVVAILSVESNLGSYTGRHRTFNVLASQAILDTPAGWRELVKAWPREKKQELKNPKLKPRLARRAAWAREELVHLARLALKRKKDIFRFKGSVAGAMGMCQFVPSSLARFGADGDGDGEVDLHEPEDAIHSVASFLLAHGWKPGLDQPGQERVIFEYNRSRTYVRTILALAEKLG